MQMVLLKHIQTGSWKAGLLALCRAFHLFRVLPKVKKRLWFLKSRNKSLTLR